MSAPRLCVECKHHKLDEALHSPEVLCTHVISRNVVTGKPVRCELARADYIGCSRDGWLWEPIATEALEAIRKGLGRSVQPGSCVEVGRDEYRVGLGVPLSEPPVNGGGRL
jgi:hypothetical protein